jgi:hypothetical protein
VRSRLLDEDGAAEPAESKEEAVQDPFVLEGHRFYLDGKAPAQLIADGAEAAVNQIRASLGLPPGTVFLTGNVFYYEKKVEIPIPGDEKLQ